MAETARQPSARRARAAGGTQAAAGGVAPRSLPPRPAVHTPADLALIEAVPLAEQGLPAGVHDLVLAAAATYGDAPAHTHLARGGGRAVETLTFRDLADRVTRVARAVASLTEGVARPVTSLLLPKGPWTLPAQWGAQAAGVANPVNPSLTDDHLLGLLRAAGTHVLVVPSDRSDPARHSRLAALARHLPTLRAVLTVDAPPVSGGVIPVRPARWPVPVRALKEAVAEHDGAPEPAPGSGAAPGDLCALFHTGGTTGRPKLAAHTHRNEIYTAWALACVLDLSPGETLLCGLPPSHVNAAHATGLGPLMAGVHVVHLGPEGFRDTEAVADLWRIIARHRVVTFPAVPTVLAELTRVRVDADISRLRHVYSSAAPLPDAVRRAFERHCGRPVLQGYGLTEATCVSTLTPPAADAPEGTVGARLPYQELRVVGPGGGPAGPGEPGRIQVRGPNVFPGYWGEAPGDPVDGDGWLDTGDLGTVRDGWLFVTGRTKDVIIRGDHKVDAGAVEDVLLAHPRVVAAAAVGRPDPHSGEVPVAYVVLGPGPGVPREELLAWAGEHIGERAAVPRDVWVCPGLPLTPVGKVNKARLREDAAVRAAHDLLRERFPGVNPELSAATGTGGRIELTVTPGPVPEEILDALADLPLTVRGAEPEAPDPGEDTAGPRSTA
ncbi:acyl-CoA synthetase [Streptomyces capparidis]